MSDLDLDELRDELADFAQPAKPVGRSRREERIIAGFEEVQRFVEKHGHAPQHGEDRDIFERLYAVRLDRLRALEDCRGLLAPLDHHGLLDTDETTAAPAADDLDIDDLAAELAGAAGESSINQLRYVRTSADKRIADEIAERDKCEDFDLFEPLFAATQRDLEAGIRTTRRFVRNSGLLKADIVEGQFFILGGQIAYVAVVGERFRAPNGETDARLRVIYANGTESNLLRRSLQRALYKDEAGRRITEPAAGPLFTDDAGDDDQASGTIYVLRSKSDHPLVVANREVLHKIGVTGGDVARRIGAAKLDPTFLMADVEIVATYNLFNVNRVRLENVIHRVFDPARLDIEVKDRFGNLVAPREWFLVPLSAIDQAVEKIKDGTMSNFVYNTATASLVTSRTNIAEGA